MKTMIIQTVTILVLVTVAFTRIQPKQSDKSALTELSVESYPITKYPGQCAYHPQSCVNFEKQFSRRKARIMEEYNSYVALIYRHVGHGEMVLQCTGQMISETALITPNECATSFHTLLIVYNCHKLDEQHLPTEDYINLMSEVTKMATVDAITVMSVQPNRPWERCKVLWKQDDPVPAETTTTTTTTTSMTETPINVTKSE